MRSAMGILHAAGDCPQAKNQPSQWAWLASLSSFKSQQSRSVWFGSSIVNLFAQIKDFLV